MAALVGARPGDSQVSGISRENAFSAAHRRRAAERPPCYGKRQASSAREGFICSLSWGVGIESKIEASPKGSPLPGATRLRGRWGLITAFGVEREDVFPATCLKELLAPGTTCYPGQSSWAQPTLTCPLRQAGKRARPIYRTDRSLRERTKGGGGSRAVFLNCSHPLNGRGLFLVRGSFGLDHLPPQLLGGHPTGLPFP